MSEALKPCPFCGCAEDDLDVIETSETAYVRCNNCESDGPLSDTTNSEMAVSEWNTRAELEQPSTADAVVHDEFVGEPGIQLSEYTSTAEAQPRLTVRLLSFPESNGKRNWTAMIARVDKWGGLIGSCGGITIARGELWNRVAYEAECAKLLIGERTTQPDILDYGDDIETPEEWKGEIRGGHEVVEAKRIREEG